MKYSLWALLFLLGFPALAHAETVIDIAFPVEGATTFINDFDFSRSRGRIHHATDMMAEKMTPIVAAVDGVIAFAPTVQPSYGYMIIEVGDDGRVYNYVHVNNDTPGTDDGKGGAANAYASGIKKGVRVTKGQHIAYVGDSGNAETTGSHLHFEIYKGKTAVNPYASLKAAQKIVQKVTREVASESKSESKTEVKDPAIFEAASTKEVCTPTSMIRTRENPNVYFCGHDGGRYLFPSEEIFLSWNTNFNEVKIVSQNLMDSLSVNGKIGARVQ